MAPWIDSLVDLTWPIRMWDMTWEWLEAPAPKSPPPLVGCNVSPWSFYGHTTPKLHTLYNIFLVPFFWHCFLLPPVWPSFFSSTVRSLGTSVLFLEVISMQCLWYSFTHRRHSTNIFWINKWMSSWEYFHRTGKGTCVCDPFPHLFLGILHVPLFFL